MEIAGSATERPIKLDFETCLAIAKLQIQRMKERGLVEAVREIHDLHALRR
jgi:hypothetical protein